MATYTELFEIQRDNILLQKIAVAVAIAADTILKDNDDTDPPWDQTNNANRKIWAKGAFSDPINTAKKMQIAVIAANESATPAQITGATDAAIQNNVNVLVDLFADGT